MARVFPRPDRNEFYIDLTDAHGVRHRLKGFESERLTQELARRLEQLRDCRQAGMLPPPDARKWLEGQPAEALAKWADMGLVDRESATANQPLTAHLEAWIADNVAAKNSDSHIRQNRQRVNDMLADGKFTYWADVTAERVKVCLAKRTQAAGTGARTYNSRLASFRAFANWCVKHDRLAADPTARIPKLNEKADPRRIRRPLPPEHLQRVI